MMKGEDSLSQEELKLFLGRLTRDNLPSFPTSPRFFAAQLDETVENLFGGDGDQSEQDTDLESQDAVDSDGFSMDEDEDTYTSQTAPTSSPAGVIVDEGRVLFDLFTDPFLCAADDESQTTLLRAMEGLNSCITHLVLSILSRFDPWIRKYYDESKFTDFKSSKRDACKTNLLLLQAFFRLKGGKGRQLRTRRMVLEVHMVERIVSTLYRTFFAGDVFFGVMDATQIDILDQMYYVILKNEPWTAVQRWRSFSSAASILTLDETCLTNIVEDLAQEINTSIAMLYPTTNVNFHKKLPEIIRNANGSSETMLKVVNIAHKLSRDLQRKCVSARLKVTMAPTDELRGDGALLAFSPELASSYESGGKEGQPGDTVLATTAFGLESFEGASNTHRVLMKPTVVTMTFFK